MRSRLYFLQTMVWLSRRHRIAEIIMSIKAPRRPRQTFSFFGGSWFDLAAGIGQQKLFCEQSDAQRREQKFSATPCLPAKKEQPKKSPTRY
jgi:hypothetical protein